MKKITNALSTFLVVGIMLAGLFTAQDKEKGDVSKAVWGESAQDTMEELEEGSFYTLRDKDSGEELEYINRRCFEDDMIILSDNRVYRIHEADHKNYYAHCKRLADFEGEDIVSLVWQGAQLPYQAVAIYTTHSDECYVPTSGTESKAGGGDILEVAETLATELEQEGIEVLHSENIHDPHDAKAYDRSRETASELLSQGSAAMVIDIHRDGIPDPAYYEAELDGAEITQIRLVVGRANENSEENIDFAKRLKAYYDEVKPGLIKSIYMAKGHYNQDLGPHCILLEVGTHTNTLEEAQRGIKEFGEALPAFLGLQAAQQGDSAIGANQEKKDEKAVKEEGKIGGGTIAIIVIVLGAIGGLAYVMMRKKP